MLPKASQLPSSQQTAPKFCWQLTFHVVLEIFLQRKAAQNAPNEAHSHHHNSLWPPDQYLGYLSNLHLWLNSLFSGPAHSPLCPLTIVTPIPPTHTPAPGHRVQLRQTQVGGWTERTGLLSKSISCYFIRSLMKRWVSESLSGTLWKCASTRSQTKISNKKERVFFFFKFV